MKNPVKVFGIISIAVVLLVLGLLAVPQFIFTVKPDITPAMGYQFFFNAYSDRFAKNHSIAGVSGPGIAAIVLLGLALISLCFSFKSSAFLMLGGLLNVVASIMFFVMNVSKIHVFGTDRDIVSVGWVAYVCGALLVLVGLVSIYVAFKSMRQEKKQIASSKSYSYLKK